MGIKDISYLLKRARSHRALALAARSVEARCIHHQFVKRYQRVLVGIRHGREPIAHPVQELLAA
jgi:hypothetical protein